MALNGREVFLFFFCLHVSRCNKVIIGDRKTFIEAPVWCGFHHFQLFTCPNLWCTLMLKFRGRGLVGSWTKSECLQYEQLQSLKVTASYFNYASMLNHFFQWLYNGSPARDIFWYSESFLHEVWYLWRENTTSWSFFTLPNITMQCPENVRISGFRAEETKSGPYK